MLEDAQTEPSPDQDSTGYLPRELLLLGAGHAHVQVLAHLARHRMTGARITLIAPHGRQLYSGMLPGFIAGRYTLDQCAIALEPLVRQSGIRWLRRSVRGLDAQAQQVLLDDGTTLHYDWLSVNTGPVQNRALLDIRIPGIRENSLFLRPLESFAALWPKVLELAEQRPLRIAVIGNGAAGIELALAIRARLPQSALTLIGPQPAGAHYPDAVQQLIGTALRQQQITLLTDSVAAVARDELTLGSGARLACDVSVVAVGAQAPVWLKDSGLALDDDGFIAVNAFQQSTSHPQVLAAGDVSSRVDLSLARSGVYAVRAGPVLAHNLGQMVAGQTLKAHQPPRQTLNLLSLGNGRAIISWGRFAGVGRFWWWLKHRIDTRFIARYAQGQVSPS